MARASTETARVVQDLIDIGLNRKFLSLLTTDEQRTTLYRLLKNHISTRLVLPKGARSTLIMDRLEIKDAWQIEMLIGTKSVFELSADLRDSRGATLAHYAAWAGRQDELDKMKDYSGT